MNQLNMKLGNLKKVDLRSIWPHEAQDFTKWLAQEENISILSEELDISIENVKVEEASGRYNADIVATDADMDRTVIIENQLEVTDHKHLGQIITYASAHDASIIIWGVKDYTEEHKQAIDWFNRNISEQISFFLVKVELWQIEASLAAPKFNIISQPNNWAKTIKNAGTLEKGTPSDLKLQQQRFWEKLKEYASKENNKTIISFGRTPRPQHWYNISYGTSRAHLSLTFNKRNQYVGCEIYIPHDDEYYQLLKDNKDKIEAELDLKLDWQDLPESTASRIITTYSCEPTDENKWPDYFNWLLSTADKFVKTFRKYK